MNAEKIREAINALNKINFFGLRHYRMGTALGMAISDGLRQLSWSKALKSLLFGCIISDFRIDVSGNGRLVFLFSPSDMDRKLLKDDFFNIAGLMPDHKTVVATRRKAKLDFTKLLYLAFYPIWFLQMLAAPLSIKQKLNLIGRMASCRGWTFFISKKIIDSPVSLFISFCDFHMYDNIAAQYCRHNSIPTATLQHGLYRSPTEDFFMSAFELFVSDKFLAWGADTEKRIVRYGIEPERICITGMLNPTEKFQPSDLPVFGVLLSGYPQHMDQVNTQLLTLANGLAEKKRLKYIVRGHPARAFTYGYLCKDEFLSFVCDPEISVFDMASKAQFFICSSTSSIAYELLNMGATVFIYENYYENFFYSSAEKLCFKTIEELERLINWKIKNENEYRQRADEISQDIFSEPNFDRYRSFFAEYLK